MRKRIEYSPILSAGWYAIPLAQVGNEELIFFIAWDVIFFFLAITMLRLPVIYPAIVALVVAAVTLAYSAWSSPGRLPPCSRLLARA